MMKNKKLPRSHDWNYFWKEDKLSRSLRISWSKQRIMKILSSYIKEDGSALDAGCGSGFFSKYFCDQKMRVMSLDYSSKALEITREKTSGRSIIVQKDLLNDDLQKDIQDRFDIIFSDGLLEHFTMGEQQKIVLNLRNILADEGVMITFVPNRFSPWEIIRPLYMPGIKEAPFILKQLMDIHEHNGLHVIDRGGINTFPFRFSPDKLLGDLFGMLLYTISKKK